MSVPDALLTDSNGANQRLRVDPGQTGFFAGRMFRAYQELNIPTAGPAVSLRFTSPVDFILWEQTLLLSQGALRLEVFAGVTPSGTWTQVPVIGVNRMSERPQPYYAAQCTLETGGSFTGGTATDLLPVRTPAANNGAQNVGGESSERGLPAGTYCVRLSTITGGIAVNDPAQGIYRLLWEERP